MNKIKLSGNFKMYMKNDPDKTLLTALYGAKDSDGTKWAGLCGKDWYRAFGEDVGDVKWVKVSETMSELGRPSGKHPPLPSCSNIHSYSYGSLLSLFVGK